MKKTAYPALLLTLLMPASSLTANAASYAIGSMNISGGGFSVDGFPDGFVAFNYIGPNTNLVGGYIGTGGAGVASTTPNIARIASANWYNLPLDLYTAAANLGDINSPAGSLVGGLVPTGTVDDMAGTITMDLRGWFANWSDGDYITGTGRSDGFTSAMATGTWDPITHAYTLHWDSATLGAGYAPCCYSHWTLEGTAAPVPVPAALWLFASGLLGLIGAAWRQKK